MIKHANSGIDGTETVRESFFSFSNYEIQVKRSRTSNRLNELVIFTNSYVLLNMQSLEKREREYFEKISRYFRVITYTSLDIGVENKQKEFKELNCDDEDDKAVIRKSFVRNFEPSTLSFAPSIFPT
jgi:hypothetical protein